jgi:hypothetical protein
VAKIPLNLFRAWLAEDGVGAPSGIRIYREQQTKRAETLPVLKELLVDHYVGEATIVASGGFKKAAEIIKNSLPASKRIRSGDLAELLATEYVNSETTYRVPIRKLRWKSDRDTPLHGNDVVGVDTSTARTSVLKCECKSRAHFKPSDADEAVAGLGGHRGRPNPSTLAFIAKRLYELGRDAEAKVFQDLLTARAIRATDVRHLVFVLSGNVPVTQLSSVVVAAKNRTQRTATAIVVKDHGAFIDLVFR